MLLQVYYNIIHNSQDIAANLVSIDGQIIKEIYNELLLSHQKEEIHI